MGRAACHFSVPGKIDMRLLKLGTIAFLVALLPGMSRAQQATGTVSGQVVGADAQPVGGVQISIAGTSRSANTDQQGRYTITGVPTGTQRLRARRLGFAPSDTVVSVTAGGTTNANIRLQQSALELGAVVA